MASYARPTVPAGPRLSRVCIAHGGLPGPRTTARVTVPLTLGTLPRGPGSPGAGGGRTQAVRAPEVRRKTLLESPSPRGGSARRNGAGRARRRRTGGRASRRTGRTGACVLRGPPEDGVPTVRRTAPGRTPHACSRRRLPRLRGFTYTSLQPRTPWCCHRALRDPEALGGRLRHFTCVCTAVRWCLCKKKLDTHRDPMVSCIQREHCEDVEGGHLHTTRVASEEISSADTLSLNFPPPEL
ncbi:uncharacterized protein LOC116578868 [Mustela erminea]|uniref:uncharacterized protein LOC116578868 n=1 Tax=Mustela erminea TaxID=36723 RepID=UPI00138768B1|nr:uncharacterized protein LOC116578868 [Mustela erminea]